MRVLLAVTDSDESVRVARTTHDLFGETATYLVMNVAAQPVPILGPDPMTWGVAYPLATGTTAGAVPLYRAPVSTTGERIPGTGDDADRARQEAERVAEAAHLTAEPIGEVGDAAQRIRAVADEEHVDVIVVGASEHGWFHRLVHPSVANAVMRDSERPVLVIPC